MQILIKRKQDCYINISKIDFRAKKVNTEKKLCNNKVLNYQEDIAILKVYASNKSVSEYKTDGTEKKKKQIHLDILGKLNPRLSTIDRISKKIIKI